MVIWAEHYKGQNHLEDQAVDGMIILIFLLQKQGVKIWSNLKWLCKLEDFREHEGTVGSIKA
jgi:hypothetical protein